ncbi:hypothetical protein [Shewanella surugensis]|uniref:DUF5673 domain-containing protein n=1 Tax=Shewanella surugensis TaxID=212020 RepID=A0ABT0LJI6_9GAMM|nr:hypothetical protein [Shewanella surugensis]MCL1127876.1 hypothetical protein [Shewanella surugensis]
MDSSIISGLIGGAIAVALCTYTSKKSCHAKAKGELKFGKFLLVLAWCSFSITGLTSIPLFLNMSIWHDPNELSASVGLVVIFGLITTYCFGEYFKARGHFNEHKIDFYTPWTGQKRELWDNLDSVTFNALGNWYRLKFTSGKIIRLSNLLNGHGDVITLLQSKGYDCK